MAEVVAQEKETTVLNHGGVLQKCGKRAAVGLGSFYRWNR
jgi:hypothetical protein